MATDYQTIIGQLKAKKFKPIYLLHGDEPYFIDQISDYIEEHVLDEAEKGFNQTVLYGKETDIGQLIETARRYPMMSEYQVLIVKEAQELKKIEELESYFANPSPTTILVLAHKYKKPDGRKKYLKTADKNGIVFESKKLDDLSLQKWIADYVKFQELQIDQKSIFILQEFLGNSLQKITNEIDKLKVLLGANGQITPKVIENNIGFSKDFNSFELQKAIGKKDITKAYQIAFYLAGHQKENPLVMIISTLYAYFSKVMAIHFSNNKSPQHIASQIKVNPYFVKDYIQASTLFTAPKVVQIIEHLKDADLKSKGVGTSQTDEGEILKELVFKILN